MTPRTAHAHDIVVDFIWDGLAPTWAYWNALQTIIDAPAADWAECHVKVQGAAQAAVKNEDLNPSHNIPGEDQ